jgi:uncharacterized membrane protein YdjX (TVP38/TMEM64 family)
MMVKFIDFLRDRLKVVILLCYVGLALLVGWDLMFVDKHHAHTWVEQHIPAWWSIFGFVACALIIILSKLFGHFKWFGKFTIMTREDYYDK